MSDHDITKFEKEIAECADPDELACMVKLLFKQLPGPFALECFARVMMSALSHPLKAATWWAVRYSHIWWGVDDMLKGDVMDHPLIRRAFVDAVPMRRRAVELRLAGWEDLLPTLSGHELDGIVPEPVGISKRQYLIASLVRVPDDVLSKVLRERFDVPDIRDFIDVRGNGILWYLTYRDDQNAEGGFACPKTARVLVDMGADPCRTNELGLCWNDVARHFVRDSI